MRGGTIRENILRAGQVIGSRQTIHVLNSVSSSEDPAGVECEEYIAICGRQSQSWSMPSQGIGGATYRFYKDLGGIDFYDNYWTVCINPKCSWPGEHFEFYEQGPY